MKVYPIDDRVLVKVNESLFEQKTAGGIVIPDTAKEKPRIGEVIEVGTDEELKKVIKKGDNILFAKYGGDELQIEGEKNLILQRSDILGKVEL